MPFTGLFATISSSFQSIGVIFLVKDSFNTSIMFSAAIILIDFLTFSGISCKSFSFSLGMITFDIPDLSAAHSFSLSPPIGKTLPLKVISPVIATLQFTGIPVSIETIDVTIAIPAEGPSLGVAPSGTCT